MSGRRWRCRRALFLPMRWPCGWPRSRSRSQFRIRSWGQCHHSATSGPGCRGLRCGAVFLFGQSDHQVGEGVELHSELRDSCPRRAALGSCSFAAGCSLLSSQPLVFSLSPAGGLLQLGHSPQQAGDLGCRVVRRLGCCRRFGNAKAQPALAMACKLVGVQRRRRRPRCRRRRRWGSIVHLFD